MDLQHLPFNWFDFVVALTLLFGLVRGRKNGLSQELLIMVQWLAMVFTGAFLYKPVGEFMTQNTVFSLLFCYVISYLVIVVLVKIFFSLIKHAVGGKLIGSDIFGRAEYYVGAPAGMVRFACVLVFLLSFLGARYYSPAEIKAKAKYDADVYGSSYWPTMMSVQIEVFQRSFSGPYIRNNIGFLFIQPTAPENKVIKQKEAATP